MGIADEFFDVLGSQSNRHALLALGNSQLSAIETIIFLGNHIQINGQAVAQLANGNRNAASAEVVAALDQAARIAAAEQALNFALNGSVALLHLGARGLDAVNVLRFRGRLHRQCRRGPCGRQAIRPCRQEPGTSRRTWFAGRAHNSADFHALGHITGVIDLMGLTGRKTNLVAIARIARGSVVLSLRCGNLPTAFRKPGAWDRPRRSHAWPDTRSCGPRGVANRAAHARCRAAEQLDLGGMVMGFVFEEEQPVLVFTIHVDGHLHRAGVNFLNSSTFFIMPLALRYFAPMVPMSMRHTGLCSRPSSARMARYLSNAACTQASSMAISVSSVVPNVVYGGSGRTNKCRQPSPR